MKYRHYFGALLIYVSLLAGCLNPSQQVAETQPVNILTASTSTPTVTVTLSLTPTLPTVTPTREASPTPPPLPTLPPRKNASSYQLTKPTPEGLLTLMDVLNTQYGYFSHFYDDKGNLIFGPMLDELSNVLHVVATETNFYYPDGFPDPQIVWEYYPFTNRDYYPVFPSMYLDSLTNAVLDDFNRHPDHLKDLGVIDGKGYTIQTYRIELDHGIAIQLLENAIAHFDQTDVEQRSKLLFAHYRLAILYALSEQDVLPRQHLKWLVENLADPPTSSSGGMENGYTAFA